MSFTNKDTSSRIQDQAKPFLDEITYAGLADVKLDEIDIQGTGIVYSGMDFVPDAANKTLSIIRVKKDFPELGENVDSMKWKTTMRTIQEANRQSAVYLLKGEIEGLGKMIVDVFEKKNEGSLPIRHSAILTQFCVSIEDANELYILKNLEWIPSEHAFGIWIHQDRMIRAGDRDWRLGLYLKFNEYEVTCKRYFELPVNDSIFLNKKPVFSSNVSQSKHRSHRVHSAIRELVCGSTEEIENELIRRVGKQSVVQASVQEFLDFRREIEKTLKNYPEVCNRALLGHFNDATIMELHKLVPQEQSKKWRRTAVSGSLAIDLPNAMTALIQETIDVMTDEQVNRLRDYAGGFLFKEELDLEGVAINHAPIDSEIAWINDGK